MMTMAVDNTSHLSQRTSLIYMYMYCNVLVSSCRVHTGRTQPLNITRCNYIREKGAMENAGVTDSLAYQENVSSYTTCLINLFFPLCVYACNVLLHVCLYAYVVIATIFGE